MKRGTNYINIDTHRLILCHRLARISGYNEIYPGHSGYPGWIMTSDSLPSKKFISLDEMELFLNEKVKGKYKGTNMGNHHLSVKLRMNTLCKQPAGNGYLIIPSRINTH